MSRHAEYVITWPCWSLLSTLEAAPAVQRPDQGLTRTTTAIAEVRYPVIASVE